MALGRKTGGRQKGGQNKTTKELRAMILGALGDAGGQEYLEKQAHENPAAFMALLGKVLPTTLTGTIGVSLIDAIRLAGTDRSG